MSETAREAKGTHERPKTKQISIDNPDEVFTLTYDKGERTCKTGDFILQACKLMDRASREDQDLDDVADGERVISISRLIEKVSDWCRAHWDSIGSAYLTPSSFGKNSLKVLLLVEQVEEAYDEALDDALIDLDLEIYNDEDIKGISLAVLSIPPTDDEGRATFLSSTLQPIRIVMEDAE